MHSDLTEVNCTMLLQEMEVLFDEDGLEEFEDEDEDGFLDEDEGEDEEGVQQQQWR